MKIGAQIRDSIGHFYKIILGKKDSDDEIQNGVQWLIGQII